MKLTEAVIQEGIAKGMASFRRTLEQGLRNADTVNMDALRITYTSRWRDSDPKTGLCNAETKMSPLCHLQAGHDGNHVGLVKWNDNREVIEIEEFL